MERENASTVAVIDDDDEVLDVLRRLFEMAGHAVETYNSGRQFLNNAEFANLACLVVDQRMPQMTGLELLSELNRRGITIPALLITGAPDAEVERHASSLGFMTVLEKPMSPQELLSFVSFSTG
ncbi:MAG: response regulator [Acetobacteraceae bacterium]|nr:response regulator [Acetobacteraceae bacterium]